MAASAETTMKAAVYNKFGRPRTVLKIVDNYPVPELASDEVMVHVLAAALNPVDYKLMNGVLGSFGPKPPKVPGLDGSGVVLHVGPSCKKLKAGDNVFFKLPINNNGTLAECTVVPEKLVALKPSNLSHQEAASLPLAAITSYQALFDTADLKSGQKVLILGGSGGTGSLAVQLAHLCGAHVAATCGTSNVEFVRSLGADVVIDYRTQKWHEELAGKDYDVVYDTVGGPDVFENAKLVLKPQGHFVTIVGDEQNHDQLGIGDFVYAGIKIAGRKMCSIVGGVKYDFVVTRDSEATLDAIKKMAETSGIRPLIDKVYPFEDVHDAFEHLASGRARGKLVVDMDIS